MFGQCWGARRAPARLDAPKMPKTVAPLTQLQVRNAKPREKAYKLADSAGLYLEVTLRDGLITQRKFIRCGKDEPRAI